MTTNKDILKSIQGQIFVGEIIEKTKGEGLVWNKIGSTQYSSYEYEFSNCTSPTKPAATWEFHLSKTVISSAYNFTLDVFRNRTRIINVDSNLAINLVDLYATVEKLILNPRKKINKVLKFLQQVETVQNQVSGPPFILRPNADLITTWNRVPAAGTWFDKIRQSVDYHDGDATYIYDLSNSDAEFGFNPLPDWAGDSFEEVELRLVVKNHSEDASTIGLALALFENDSEVISKSFTTPITSEYVLIENMFWRRSFNRDDINNLRVRLKASTAINYITAIELIVRIENTASTTDEDGSSGVVLSGSCLQSHILNGSIIGGGRVGGLGVTSIYSPPPPTTYTEIGHGGLSAAGDTVVKPYLEVGRGGLQTGGQAKLPIKVYVGGLRASINGVIKVIETSGSATTVLNTAYEVLDIKVDGLVNKIFWIDYNTLNSCNLDGSSNTVLVTRSQMNNISLDIQNGYVYYTAEAKFYRCNYDGTGDTLMFNPYPFIDSRNKEIDFVTHNGYFIFSALYPAGGGSISNIYSCRYDGTNFQNIYTYGPSSPSPFSGIGGGGGLDIINRQVGNIKSSSRLDAVFGHSIAIINGDLYTATYSSGVVLTINFEANTSSECILIERMNSVAVARKV